MSYVQNRPWWLLGDFNASFHIDDKSVGSSYVDTAMRDFQYCVEAIEVADVNFVGLRFTWNQKPGEIVSIGWQSSVSGFWMYQVVQRLKLLKKSLRKLLFDQGNIIENVKRLRHELDEVQRALDADPHNVKIREDEAAYLQAFNDALIVEERFLKQKAKVEWLKSGDANYAYFHKVVKIHVSRNRIDSVTTSSGARVDGDQVPIVFIDHYTAFLGQQGVTTPLLNNNLFCTKLSTNVADYMICAVSDQEIRNAIFSIGGDKSPGPDGFSIAFFKEAWDIISQDVIKVVKEFFINGVLLKELNHTIIALIPKVDTLLKINDYRPISCCNVLFKYISKIISHRMKDSLMELVSLNQFEFIPGRRISDNTLLTQELMHNYHFDRGPLRYAFKVDIQKAYDTVIMDSLEEFKNVFGLTPSLPKSTAYFCNVLNYVKMDILNPNSVDGLMWKDHNDITSGLSVATVWDCIRPRGLVVDWYHLVWFSHQIPRHAIHLWLVIKQKLKTQDTPRQWDVWEQVKTLIGIPNMSSTLDLIVEFLIPLAKKRSARFIIAKLVFAASCYFIWQERNNTLFIKQKRSYDQIIEVIQSNVRLKLLSCKFKKTKTVQILLNRWRLPDSLIHHTE
ncbi:sodium/hydrogen exchanger 6 [Tanacetum coccineum]